MGAPKLEPLLVRPGDAAELIDASVRLLERVTKTETCWLFRGARKQHSGYGLIKFQGRQWKAHRLSYLAHVGPIPEGAMVLHRCAVRICVRPDHLYVGDAKQNARDTVAHGHAPRGERQAMSRLTAEMVAAARVEHASGVTQVELARRFGVNKSTMRRAISGKTWGHVP